MIGDKIREIRKERGLTLKTLAEAAGVTASYISQLEHNTIDPSLSSLRKIARAFGVSMSAFLEEDDSVETALLIKSSERRKLPPKNSSVRYEYLSPISADVPGIRMEVLHFSQAPKRWSSEDFLVHPAEECICVLSGSLRIFAGKETYELGEGDSLYLRDNVPHRIYNPGDIEAIGFSCISPVI